MEGDCEAAGGQALGYPEAGYLAALRMAAEKLAARSNRTSVPAVRTARLYVPKPERTTEPWNGWRRPARSATSLDSSQCRVGLGPRRPDPRFQDLLRRMNFPPQGCPRPLAPHFLRAPPMQFRSVNAQLRNRPAYMATRENSPSEHLCQIVPVEQAFMNVGF